MDNDLRQILEVLDKNRPPMTLKGRFILFILFITLIFLAISAVFIDASDYSAKYGGNYSISYDETYHYYPGLVLVAYIGALLFRIYWQGQILRKNPNLPPEKRVIRLTWDMLLIAAFFIWLQVQAFSALNIHAFPNLPG